MAKILQRGGKGNERWVRGIGKNILKYITGFWRTWGHLEKAQGILRDSKQRIKIIFENQRMKRNSNPEDE